LGGAWNALCCIPATFDDNARRDSIEQQQPLLNTDSFHSTLYTENRQQVAAFDMFYLTVLKVKPLCEKYSNIMSLIVLAKTLSFQM